MGWEKPREVRRAILPNMGGPRRSAKVSATKCPSRSASHAQSESGMLCEKRNRLLGSYLRLTSTKRSRFVHLRRKSRNVREPSAGMDLSVARTLMCELVVLILGENSLRIPIGECPDDL